MSKSLAVMLALLATAAPLAAQETADSAAILRALLARVEAQRGVQEQAQRQEEVRRAPEHRGRIQTEGRLTVLVMAVIPRDEVARAAVVADSSLQYFGGVPDSFTRSLVQVTRGSVSDSAELLAAPAMRGRTRIELQWRPDGPNGGGTQAWSLIQPVAAAYAATLDRAWRDWLPRNYGIQWDAEGDGEQAISDLAAVSGYEKGKQCLAGQLRSCRLWLGVDNDPNVFTARYTPRELVDEAKSRIPLTADGRACRENDADACARALQALPYDAVSRVPASEHARASLIRALRERHGAAAVRRALADSAGSIGERLARAAGLPEDSLISEWRMWVLSRGRTERVSAGAGEFASALIFILFLVAMATRSGRWR